MVNLRSDALLVASVIRRNHHGLSVLYDRYAALAYSILLRITRDQSVAADLLQELFHRMPAIIADYNVTCDCLDSWMVLSARRQGVDHIRSVGRKPAQDEGKAVNDQLMLDLVIFEGCSLREIAGRLNEPPRVIGNRMRAAIKGARDLSKIPV